jgi:hypothetical protein
MNLQLAYTTVNSHALMSLIMVRKAFQPVGPPCDCGFWSRFKRACAIARSLRVRNPAEKGKDGKKKKIMNAVIIVGIPSILGFWSPCHEISETKEKTNQEEELPSILIKDG